MNFSQEQYGEAFQDIVTLAEHESAQMGHYYLGVEHLFIALTRLEDGATCNALREFGLSARFVRHSVRATTGAGDHHRYWPSFRPTPRYQAILTRAAALAHARRAAGIEERDLLVAILQEGRSIPARILVQLGVDLERIAAVASGWQPAEAPRQPLIPVTGAELNADQQRVLSEMFRAYASLKVQREFAGFSGARVLLVQPIKTDGRADAPVVVKLDDSHAIRYEKTCYDTYVKSTLPPITARIADPPVVLEARRIGGLKYTLVGARDITRAQTLYAYVRANGAAALSAIITDRIYNTFGVGWWKQRQPYSFHLWQEYEHVLPHALVVEHDPSLQDTRRVLTPGGAWSRDGSVHVGDVVMLDEFTIHRVYPAQQQVTLAGDTRPSAAARAQRVIVRGVAQQVAVQGDRAPRLLGRVVETRQDTFNAQARALFPHFDLAAPTVAPLPGGEPLPNPLTAWARLLDTRVNGTLSTLHGDLHLGNILIDPSGVAWLIDFRWSRDGHTLFDWAVLEVSILADLVAPLAGADLAPAAEMVALLNDPHAGAGTLSHPLAEAFEALTALRRVVWECLADLNDWREYHAALAMCALRGLGWPTVSADARRLLFVVAALSLRAQQAVPGRPDSDITRIQTSSGSFETRIDPDAG